jgi:lipoprotein-releasing system permease protein
MYKLFMALRYLRAHRIIYFSIAGVAVGIAVMIIVLSVMGGFSRTMKERIRGVQSDIVVRSVSHDLVFLNPDEIAAEIRQIPHVTGCAPRLEYLIFMTGRAGIGRREIRESMRFPDFLLVGIDPAQERGTGELQQYFEKGRPGRLDEETFQAGELDLPTLIAGSEVAGQNFYQIKVSLQTARHADLPIWLMKEYQIRGWFKSGMAEYDSKLLFADIRTVQEFLRFNGGEGTPVQPYANVLAVGIDDYRKHAPEVQGRILDVLHSRKPCSSPRRHEDGICGQFAIRTWEEERSTLLAAVEVEKGIQSVILFCIVIVAGFNIIAIYTLMVRAKTRDVGILKSLGGTPGGITSIFLLSGAACGFVGSLVGIGIGLLISVNLNGIVDFVRISSRELNYLALGRRSLLWWAMGLSAGALAALIVSWTRLYRRWRWHDWITSGLAGLLLGSAALAFFAWVPKYRAEHEYDWPIPAGVRIWIVIIGGGLPLLWCLVRRLADSAYDSALGGFLRILGTALYSALALGALGAASVALALALTRPGSRFLGYDLFPRNIYYFDRVPVEINPVSIGWVVGLTLAVSVIFSIYPAIRAARTDPIEAIRDE